MGEGGEGRWGYTIEGSAPKPGWVLHLVPMETAGDDKSLPSCITGSSAFPKPRFPTELRVSGAGAEAVSTRALLSRQLCQRSFPVLSSGQVQPVPLQGTAGPGGPLALRVCVRKSSAGPQNLGMLREGVQREPAAL